MKQTKTFGLIFVLMALLCSVQSWAGSSYYKNMSVTIKNPETAKGRVYLAPHVAEDSAYCTISKDPKEGKVVGSISDLDGEFKVDMFVFPADGYVLDRLVPPESYARGDYSTDAVANADGYPISSSVLTLDSDTLSNCSKVRPEKGTIPQPVLTCNYYSIFKPAKKASVRNKRAGGIAQALKASRYGEATNDLIVIGPLNGDDLKYLNGLSKHKGLMRLDLSGASFATVPDSAFFNSGLYELKLPPTVKKVGDYAFANSVGLKPVKLPKGIHMGRYAIKGCLLMELLGVKDTTVPLIFDDPVLRVALFGY